MYSQVKVSGKEGERVGFDVLPSTCASPYEPPRGLSSARTHAFCRGVGALTRDGVGVPMVCGDIMELLSRSRKILPFKAQCCWLQSWWEKSVLYTRKGGQRSASRSSQ